MSTDPFITTTDLVNYIGRGGTADPGMIIAVDAACDMCRAVSEQTFNQVVGDTLTVDGTGTDTILLPQLPVTAAGTVVVDGGTVTDYVLDTVKGMLVRKDTSSDVSSTCTTLTWPEGRQNVVVTYDHGYADADMPRDVRMVALAIAARLVIQGPMLSETVGDDQARYAIASTDLTNGERRILRKHGKRR